MANANNTSVVFTMKFDPADLAKLSSQINAALGGKPATGGSPTPSGVTSAGGGSSNSGSNIFVGMFKSLLALEGIKQFLSIISRNSTVANSYFGALGKVFGAAIDMLLIPFTPIFDLLLVGMSKLIDWLSRDDVQKFLGKVADFLIKGIDQIATGFNNLYNVLNKIYDKIKGPISDTGKFISDNTPGPIKRAASTIWDHFKGILPGLVVGELGLGLASKLPVVGGLARGVLGLQGGALSGAGSLAGNLLPGSGFTAGGAASAGGIAALVAGSVLAASAAANFLPKGAVRDIGGAPARWLLGKNATGGNSDVSDFSKLPSWAQNDVRKKLGNTTASGDDINKAIQQAITINVYDASDPKKVAEIVKQELAKAGGYATRR